MNKTTLTKLEANLNKICQPEGLSHGTITISLAAMMGLSLKSPDLQRVPTPQRPFISGVGDTLKMAKEWRYMADITVIYDEEKQEWIIIDGGHRYEALKIIKAEATTTEWDYIKSMPIGLRLLFPPTYDEVQIAGIFQKLNNNHKATKNDINRCNFTPVPQAISNLLIDELLPLTEVKGLTHKDFNKLKDMAVVGVISPTEVSNNFGDATSILTKINYPEDEIADKIAQYTVITNRGINNLKALKGHLNITDFGKKAWNKLNTTTLFPTLWATLCNPDTKLHDLLKVVTLEVYDKDINTNIVQQAIKPYTDGVTIDTMIDNLFDNKCKIQAVTYGNDNTYRGHSDSIITFPSDIFQKSSKNQKPDTQIRIMWMISQLSKYKGEFKQNQLHLQNQLDNDYIEDVTEELPAELEALTGGNI